MKANIRIVQALVASAAFALALPARALNPQPEPPSPEKAMKPESAASQKISPKVKPSATRKMRKAAKPVNPEAAVPVAK